MRALALRLFLVTRTAAACRHVHGLGIGAGGTFNSARVVAAAVQTLEPDYVELNCRFLVTVLAQDIGFVVPVFCWHRSQGHFVIQESPEIGHVEEGHLTRGTSIMTRV